MSQRRIQSALISVFYKDGLEPLLQLLHQQGVQLYSTGGTQAFIEQLGLPCTAVESVTGYPSILGGRVKTLHPSVFGGILARREDREHMKQAAQYNIPMFDLVIVDLYPFEETVAKGGSEAEVIEKIDIGGVSLIRAAGKNYKDVCILAAKEQYASFTEMLRKGNGETTLEQRRQLAAAAFKICAHYDQAISDYFNPAEKAAPATFAAGPEMPLRYGENPHQNAAFYGNTSELFDKLNGKELSYNNLVDVDAALQLMQDLGSLPGVESRKAFAIIKHTNVCGVALRDSLSEAWNAALAGDPESAFGGVLIANETIDEATAATISELFFEILIAPGFEEKALEKLKSKKNRILLQQKANIKIDMEVKRVLNGILTQQPDTGNTEKWEEKGARETTEAEKAALNFGNIVCKHLKSNAIAIVKGTQLIGKGCGQTSRIDALRQALDKARQFGFDTTGAQLASDAFFPFDDCARMAHEAGITAIIQPGGSVRDGDTIQYCAANNMALVLTGMRHFRH